MVLRGIQHARQKTSQRRMSKEDTISDAEDIKEEEKYRRRWSPKCSDDEEEKNPHQTGQLFFIPGKNTSNGLGPKDGPPT